MARLKKLRQVFSNVRFQMILIFSVFTVIVTVVTGSICLYYLYQRLEQEAVDYSIQSAAQISMEAQILLDEATKILQWGNSDDAYEFLTAGEDRHLETRRLIYDINMYRTSSLIDSTIENVYLFDTDGTAYNEKVGVYQTDRYEKSKYIYQMVVEQQDHLVYISGEDAGNAEEDFILYGTAVEQTATRKIIGYVVIEFKNTMFDSYVKDIRMGKSGACFILSSEGQLISGEREIYQDLAGAEAISFSGETEYQEIKRNGKSIICVNSEIPYTDWYLLGCAYKSELTVGFRPVALLICVIMSVLLFLVICVYYLVATKLTRPIWRLKEKMLQAAGGDLDAFISISSHNEFAVLEEQYNKMLRELKLLMEKTQEDQKSLQKAEFKALQSQIAPHFLYNTLDTIIWLVAVGDNERAIEMIENLSIFFKTGLSKGMDWIRVSGEIDHVTSYLYIQQSRYSDILTYSMDIDENMYEYEMLKMTLQPIVENAIYHGIKNKVEGGSICIKGYFETPQIMIFEITDTGVGMEEREVQELNRRMLENVCAYEDKENGFGLYNVNRRIRLYYGDDFGIVVKSCREEGTSVKIRLRAVKGELSGV